MLKLLEASAGDGLELDTARLYENGRSEELLGRMLRKPGLHAPCCIATKLN